MQLFERTDYLSWYIPLLRRNNIAINLHSSGVAALREGEISAATGDPWMMTPLFEGRLSKWLGIPKDQLIFTPGATGGTLLALLTVGTENQNFIVEHPIYEPMLRQAERLGSVEIFHRTQDNSWRLNAEEIMMKVRGNSPLAMITEPSNPSGTYADRNEILNLADRLAERNGFLLINEVYRLFTTNQSFHGQRKNIIIVSSFSKLIGTYWARLGWISADESIISSLRQGHLNFGTPSQPSAAFGISVLGKLDHLVPKAANLAAAGIPIVDQWVEKTAGVNWCVPDGCGFGALQLPREHRDDIAFAEKLLRDFSILTIPGTFFFAPGTLRISWLQTDLSKLSYALDCIAQSL